MKFESTLGIGEIANYLRYNGKGEIVSDELVEVVAITFNMDDSIGVMVRMSNGRLQAFAESELDGDELFNQDTGEYPLEPEE